MRLISFFIGFAMFGWVVAVISGVSLCTWLVWLGLG